MADLPSDPIRFGSEPLRFLVTGATGFVGQALVQALRNDGHAVMVLTRNMRKADALFKGNVEITESMQSLPASRTFDVVVNLAGARILGPRWTAARKDTLLRSRIGVTESLVQWFARAEHKPALLLSASAVGYYGIQPREDATPRTEESKPQNIFMSRLCQEWEAAAHAASRYGTHVVCMRFGLVLGHGGALPMMLLPIRLGLGGRLGDGRQWLSWIHLDDLVRGIAHLCTTRLTYRANGATQEGHIDACNFTAPDSVPQATFTGIAAGIYRRPHCIPTPAFPVRLALGEQADLLLEGQRVAPARLQQEGFTFRYPDLHSALGSLR